MVLQMAYIMSVNANILADTGGPCSVTDCTVSSLAVTADSIVAFSNRVFYSGGRGGRSTCKTSFVNERFKAEESCAG